MAATCLRRTEAITELVYEEAAAQHMPETYRYQRLARTRIAGWPHWGVCARGKNSTRQYLAARVGTQSA
eukprot:6817063-Lingulodinium_polyedra.AAC.1